VVIQILLKRISGGRREANATDLFIQRLRKIRCAFAANVRAVQHACFAWHQIAIYPRPEQRRCADDGDLFRCRCLLVGWGRLRQ
jgi:hypothetical protein